jgi:hypothetical protein
MVKNTNDSGTDSFRQAILDANSAMGLDTIVFNIPGAGVHTISVSSALPAITDPVIIDGTAQTIELSGSLLGASANGLQVGSGGGGTTIQALVINSFQGAGIKLDANGNTIAGNFIGTDPAGATAKGNGEGIFINNSSGNTIGGAAAVSLAAGAGNLISGNTSDGILIQGASATGNSVKGNFIGTNAAGTSPVANAGQGVHINLSSGLMVQTIWWKAIISALI